MKSINTKQNDMMRRINTRQSSAPVSSYQDIQTTAQVFVSKPIPKEMINNALQVFDSKPVPKKLQIIQHKFLTQNQFRRRI